MKFKNYDNVENSASSVMTLNYNNGNVGIGTEDPLSKLHIEGTTLYQQVVLFHLILYVI